MYLSTQFIGFFLITICSICYIMLTEINLFYIGIYIETVFFYFQPKLKLYQWFPNLLEKSHHLSTCRTLDDSIEKTSSRQNQFLNRYTHTILYMEATK